MARPKRALGELGKVTYTVEPSGLVIARGRVFDGNGHERRPSGSGATEAEALAALQEAADVVVARDLLGHSDAAITEGHYAKRPDLIVEIAADALDEVFAGIDA